MKMKFYSVAMAALLVGGMASCSSDVNDGPEMPADGTLQMKLAAKPDVNV